MFEMSFVLPKKPRLAREILEENDVGGADKTLEKANNKINEAQNLIKLVLQGYNRGLGFAKGFYDLRIQNYAGTKT